MKTTLKSPNFVRGLFYLCSLIIIFLSPASLSAGEILNVNSIKISKDYPASFVLDLERNDIVTIKYNKIGGSADLSQLLVQIIDLNQQEEVVMGSFNRSGRDFLVSYEGKYRIDFIYNGPGGLLKQRNLILSLSLDLEGFSGLQKGESMEILHSTSCVIEDSEANALQIRYYLTEGDKITVSSNDSKSAYLKLKITQLAKMISVTGSQVINIPSDGTYSFKFYLEGSDNNSLLNLRELLSKDDVLFRDLSIYRERAVDFAALVNANAGGNASNNNDLLDSSEGGSGETDPMNNFIDLEKILADGNKNTSEINQAIIESIKSQQEFMAEMMNKKTIKTDIYSVSNDLKMTLAPEFNFASNNQNRKCEIINLPPSNFNIWFYWIGVGDDAKNAYDEHNKEIEKSFKMPLDDAAAAFYYYKFSNTNAGIRSPSFPDESKYGQYLFEDAEYAIVDYFNMQRFMDGKRYSKLNQPSRNAKFITSDNGISPKPTFDGDIYFCACNNNKATPVNIYFKYIVIEYEEKEY